MEKECIFIDVFTNTAYSGNQLAVFPHADDLKDEQMQKLANEINYPETTFILNPESTEEDFRIRIFSIYCEMPFAGHPTLGTAFSIMKILNNWPAKKDIIRLKTNVGIIPLENRGDLIWMKQNKPEFFKQYDNKSEIANLIGLSLEDILDLPIEEVSTGNNMLIIPIKNLAAISRAFANVNKLKLFFEKSGSLAPYLFTTETFHQESNVHTRFFAPHLGILEDPATGSAAGPLTGYLLKHNLFGKEFELINEQGIEMKRPSRILMKGKLENDKYTVKIGGSCAFVGRGIFKI
jgi:trans-2,3-dihydro-3-hydroxyanthranilate isomerase